MTKKKIDQMTNYKKKVMHYNNEMQKIQEEGIDLNDISDGYHTFGELYKHRIHLFIALVNSLGRIDRIKGDTQTTRSPVLYRAYKSMQHGDGKPMYDGFFIAGVGTERGEQISYHLPIKYWNDLECPEVGHSPEFDGHSSDDVLSRLLKI